MIDLQQFCSTDPGRPALLRPWAVGDKAYASNGHIIVRVRSRADIPESDAAPNAPKLFEAHAVTDLSPVRISLPAPAEKECDDCDGGQVHSCPTCHCVCPTCNGTMKVADDRYRVVSMRGNLFQEKYIRQLLALPGLRCANSSNQHEPMFFAFDEGDGLLMPVRSAPYQEVIEEDGEGAVA